MKEPSFASRGEYEIKVRGHLDERWSLWFEGMTISTGFGQDGTPVTTFTSPIVDQATLHGVLAKIRDINMPPISVNQTEADLKDEFWADLIDFLATLASWRLKQRSITQQHPSGGLSEWIVPRLGAGEEKLQRRHGDH